MTRIWIYRRPLFNFLGSVTLLFQLGLVHIYSNTRLYSCLNYFPNTYLAGICPRIFIKCLFSELTTDRIRCFFTDCSVFNLHIDKVGFSCTEIYLVSTLEAGNFELFNTAYVDYKKRIHWHNQAHLSNTRI